MHLFAEFLNDLWWPLFAVAALVVLRSALGRIGSLGERPAAAAQDIVRRGLGAEGLSTEQRTALRQLTADELDVFLLVSYSDQHQYDTGLAPELLRATLRRLAGAGLITIIDETNPRYVTHETTALGKRLRALLVSCAAASVRDAA